jgi:hypothetical protein
MNPMMLFLIFTTMNVSKGSAATLLVPGTSTCKVTLCQEFGSLEKVLDKSIARQYDQE